MKIGPFSLPDNSRSSDKSQQPLSKQIAGLVRLGQIGVQAGDLVKGQVVSIDAEGLVTIESAAGRFTAKSLSALFVGDKILIEIIKAGDDPLVNIAPKGKEQHANLRQSASTDGSDRLSIQAGNTVKGKVFSVDSRGVLTIKPATVQHSVKSPAVLSVGDQVLLKSTVPGNKPSDNLSQRDTGQHPIAKQSSETVKPAQVEVGIRTGDIVRGKVVSVESQGKVTIESASGRFAAKSLTAVPVGETRLFEIIKAGDTPLVNSVSEKPQHLGQKQYLGTVELGQANTQVAMGVKAKVLSVDSKGVVVIEPAAGQSSAKTVGVPAPSVGDSILMEIVQAANNSFANPDQGGPAQGKREVFDLLRVLMPLFKPGNGINPQGIMDSFLVGQKAAGAGIEGQILAKSTSEEQLLQFLTKNAADTVPDPAKQMKIASLVSSLKRGTLWSKTLQTVLGISGADSLEKVSHPELRKMAQLLEAHAVLNSKDRQVLPQPGSTQPVDFLLFPCFFASEAGAGEWLYSFEKEESGEQQGTYNVAFYLTMSRLGDVHLQLTFDKTSLSGVFTLENESAAQHVQAQVQELQETLKSLFGNAAFTCRVASKKSIERLKSDLQQKAGIETFALLDVTA